MSNAHIKPNDFKERRRLEAEAIHPETPRDTIWQHCGQLRNEVVGLRAENERLRPLKSDLARLRASLADLFFAASEEILGDQDAT